MFVFLKSLSTGLMAVLVSAAIANAAMQTDYFQGKISVVTGDALTIIDNQGTMVGFNIAADCAIMRDGKSAKVDELAVGDAVQISATSVGGRHTAKTISARSRE